MISALQSRCRAKGAWLATVATATMLAHPALAQSSDDRSKVTELEDIVVTGSRVARQGFEAPTPTTVIGQDDIARVAAPNIADVINQMPSLRATLTPQSSTNTFSFAAGNYVDLRGLGFDRTLVLVDGKRFTSAQVQGGVDLNAIPQALVGGVEIVTGGASAAYGSGAVAGVVNLKFNRQLDGLKGTIQGGTSEHGDHQNYLVSLGYGVGFAGDRGRLLVAGEIYDNNGVASLADRDWGAKSWAIIPNPAYTAANAEPRNLLVSGRRSANLTSGGVILSGPLAGTQFLPGGEPAPFRTGTLVSATAMVGGDGADPTPLLALETPLERKNAYTRVSFALTPRLTAFGEASYSESRSHFPSTVRSDTALRINRDNPFLPAATAQAMDAAGVTSFTMGRLHSDIGRANFVTFVKTRRLVAGLEGDLGRGWSFDAYYAHGEAFNRAYAENNRYNSRFTAALDATRDPTTGAAICRSAAARAEGCVPLNLFGDGAPSAASVAYVNVTSRTANLLEQDIAAATLRGEPLSTWAGPVSVAVGAEWRKEQVDVTSDALSSSFALGTGNLMPWSGQMTVREAFGEAVIPLAADMALARSLELNLAGRVTDYSTSGTVQTWKIGATWDLNGQVRFRGTLSRDIRAPTLNDLFAQGSSSVATVLDPQLGRNVTIQAFNGGNPALKPEKADTTTLGVVLSPSITPNFRLSVDYYDIDVKGALLTLTTAAIVDRCYRDSPQLCSQIRRNAAGDITQVLTSPANLQSIRESGVDVEIGYRLSVGDANLTFRGLINYLDKLWLTDAGVVTRLEGATDQPSISGVGGTPHWRGNASATYERGPWTASLTGRYVGGGTLNNDYTSKDLNVLHSGDRLYLDVSGSYDLTAGDDGRTLALFVAVTNLANQDPPITGAAGGAFATSRALYDMIGRVYTAGVRFKY